jgi:hypothetical protein
MSYTQEGREKKQKELANSLYEERGLGKPKKKLKKVYVIQYRLRPAVWEDWKKSDGYFNRIHNEWRKWRGYATKHSRLQAYACLLNKDDFFAKNYEFRLA